MTRPPRDKLPRTRSGGIASMRTLTARNFVPLLRGELRNLEVAASHMRLDPNIGWSHD